jgi:predicted ATPase
MLTELQLSNFKSWRELDIKLGRVTGLFGTNSSGKSSILQFLLMLKQTAESPDKGLVLDLGGQNQLVNLGSFKDFIFQHREELILQWTIIFEIKKDEFAQSIRVSYKNKQIQEEVVYYKIPYYLEKHEVHILNKNITTEFHYWEAHRAIFSIMYYLAPLREYPKREYQWSGASPSHVGYRGENAIHAILAATFRNETRIIPESNEEKPFQEVIAYWLKKLGLIHEFKLKEIAEGTGLFHAIVKKEPESTEAFLTDVGFGVSQVLPALVLLYYVPEGSIILMEQPEIHLHPSVQSGLADVILQVSKQRNIQVIVESHSEHLLQRFQRRVAEESYPVDELKLYFCDSQQGESKLIDLEIDEFGDIKNYPDNFFGDEMAEIAATRIAGLKHKMREAAKNGG